MFAWFDSLVPGHRVNVESDCLPAVEPRLPPFVAGVFAGWESRGRATVAFPRQVSSHFLTGQFSFTVDLSALRPYSPMRGSDAWSPSPVFDSSVLTAMSIRASTMAQAALKLPQLVVSLRVPSSPHSWWGGPSSLLVCARKMLYAVPAATIEQMIAAADGEISVAAKRIALGMSFWQSPSVLSLADAAASIPSPTTLLLCTAAPCGDVQDADAGALTNYPDQSTNATFAAACAYLSLSGAFSAEQAGFQRAAALVRGGQSDTEHATDSEQSDCHRELSFYVTAISPGGAADGSEDDCYVGQSPLRPLARDYLSADLTVLASSIEGRLLCGVLLATTAASASLLSGASKAAHHYFSPAHLSLVLDRLDDLLVPDAAGGGASLSLLSVRRWEAAMSFLLSSAPVRVPLAATIQYDASGAVSPPPHAAGASFCAVLSPFLTLTELGVAPSAHALCSMLLRDVVAAAELSPVQPGDALSFFAVLVSMGVAHHYIRRVVRALVAAVAIAGVQLVSSAPRGGSAVTPAPDEPARGLQTDSGFAQVGLSPVTFAVIGSACEGYAAPLSAEAGSAGAFFEVATEALGIPARVLIAALVSQSSSGAGAAAAAEASAGPSSSCRVSAFDGRVALRLQEALVRQRATVTGLLVEAAELVMDAVNSVTSSVTGGEAGLRTIRIVSAEPPVLASGCHGSSKAICGAFVLLGNVAFDVALRNDDELMLEGVAGLGASPHPESVAEEVEIALRSRLAALSASIGAVVGTTPQLGGTTTAPPPPQRGLLSRRGSVGLLSVADEHAVAGLASSCVSGVGSGLDTLVAARVDALQSACARCAAVLHAAAGGASSSCYHVFLRAGAGVPPSQPGTPHRRAAAGAGVPPPGCCVVAVEHAGGTADYDVPAIAASLRACEQAAVHVFPLLCPGLLDRVHDAPTAAAGSAAFASFALRLWAQQLHAFYGEATAAAATDPRRACDVHRHIAVSAADCVALQRGRAGKRPLLGAAAVVAAAGSIGGSWQALAQLRALGAPARVAIARDGLAFLPAPLAAGGVYERFVWLAEERLAPAAESGAASEAGPSRETRFPSRWPEGDTTPAAATLLLGTLLDSIAFRFPAVIAPRPAAVVARQRDLYMAQQVAAANYSASASASAEPLLPPPHYRFVPASAVDFRLFPLPAAAAATAAGASAAETGAALSPLRVQLRGSLLQALERLRGRVLEPRLRAVAVVGAAAWAWLRRARLRGAVRALRALQRLHRTRPARRVLRRARAAAVALQRRMRVWRSQRSLAAVRAAARRLQRWWRTRAGRLGYLAVRATVRRMRAAALGFLLRRRLAAERAQAAADAEAAAARALERACDDAAATLQALWRGWTWRARNAPQLEATRVRAQARVLHGRLCRAQALWRGARVRAALAGRRVVVAAAATVIQAWMRGHRPRVAFAAARAAAAALQRWWRRYLTLCRAGAGGRYWLRRKAADSALADERERVRSCVLREEEAEEAREAGAPDPDSSTGSTYTRLRLLAVDVLRDVGSDYPAGWGGALRPLLLSGLPAAAADAADDPVVSIAVGGHHSVAACVSGRVLTWGCGGGGGEAGALGHGLEQLWGRPRVGPPGAAAATEAAAAGRPLATRARHALTGCTRPAALAPLRYAPSGGAFPTLPPAAAASAAAAPTAEALSRRPPQQASAGRFAPSGRVTAGASPRCTAAPPATAGSTRSPLLLLRAVPSRVVVVQVAAGDAHSLLRTERGCVFAFGDNSRGQCGVELSPATSTTTAVGGGGAAASRRGRGSESLNAGGGPACVWEPTELPRLRAHAVTLLCAGAHHSLALDLRGNVFQWGDAVACGLSPSSDAAASGMAAVWAPARAAASGFASASSLATAIATSSRACYAVTNDGRAFAWGSCSGGLCGLGAAAAATAGQVVGPTQLWPPLPSALLPPASGASSSGPGVCVGGGGGGELVEFLMRQRATGPPDALRAGRLVAGPRHVLLQTRGGALLAWGWNRFGQLGTGDRADRSLPAPVRGLPASMLVTDFACGYRHSAAIVAGAVWQWGAVPALSAPAPAAAAAAASGVLGQDQSRRDPDAAALDAAARRVTCAPTCIAAAASAAAVGLSRSIPVRLHVSSSHALCATLVEELHGGAEAQIVTVPESTARHAPEAEARQASLFRWSRSRAGGSAAPRSVSPRLRQAIAGRPPPMRRPQAAAAEDEAEGRARTEHLSPQVPVVFPWLWTLQAEAASGEAVGTTDAVYTGADGGTDAVPALPPYLFRRRDDDPSTKAAGWPSQPLQDVTEDADEGDSPEPNASSRMSSSAESVSHRRPPVHSASVTAPAALSLERDAAAPALPGISPVHRDDCGSVPAPVPAARTGQPPSVVPHGGGSSISALLDELERDLGISLARESVQAEDDSVMAAQERLRGLLSQI